METFFGSGPAEMFVKAPWLQQMMAKTTFRNEITDGDLKNEKINYYF